MSLLPSCRDLSSHLTDYLEGRMSPASALGFRLHLIICPPCQAFADSLKGLPGFLKTALGPCSQQASSAVAKAALDGALARLGEPRQVRPGPCCELPDEVRAARAAGTSDRALDLMAEVHARILAEGPADAPPHLPAGALAGAAPASPRIHPGLGGLRCTRLLAEGPVALYLVNLGADRCVPAHLHPGSEHTLVLHGGLEDGLRHYGPGAWTIQAPGSAHAPQATGRGCWALVRLEGTPRFSGWRGWFQRSPGRP